MRVALAAVALLTVMSYAPIRTASFVYEDSNAVFANDTVTGKSPIPLFRARWLSATSHRVVWTLAGDRPAVHHAVNLGLHLLNGLLVYGIAAAFLSPVGSLLTAALFLLHPLQTEAVAYVASRSELLAASFALGAVWLSLRARRWYQHAGVWALVVAALCAKESAVVIIPLLMLVDGFQGKRIAWWRYVALVLPVAVVAWSVWVLDFRAASEMGPIRYAAEQAYAIWTYLATVIVPTGQTVDRDFDFVAISWKYVALYGLFVLAAVPLAFGLSVRYGDTRQKGRLWDDHPALKAVAFGVAWLVIGLVPRLVMRIPETINEHQTLLPFVGVWVVIGAVAAEWVKAGIPRLALVKR